MSERSRYGLYTWGKVVKPHGIKGAFIADCQFTDPGGKEPEKIYMRYPHAQWVPYRVSSLKAVPNSNRNLFFVKLEGVETRSEAEALRDCRLMTTEKPCEPEETFSPAGYMVVREDGTSLGCVSDIVQTAAHPVMIVDTGKKNVLVPWIDQYVTAWSRDSETVHVRNTDDLENLE